MALEPLLKKVLQWGQALGGNSLLAMEDQVANANRLAMKRLVSIDLPQLDKISLNDIMLVRMDSDGFNSWRNYLEKGLTRINNAEVTNKALAKAVRETLAEGQHALDAEINKSSLLHQAVIPQAITLIVGTLGSIATGGPIGVATGATTGALAVLVNLFRNRNKHKGQQALSRHYALWADK